MPLTPRSWKMKMPTNEEWDMLKQHAPEIHRLAKELEEKSDVLRAELDKYREAHELWDALELSNGEQVSEATLIAKVTDFDSGVTAITMSVTDGCDWVTQIGLYQWALTATQRGVEKNE